MANIITKARTGIARFIAPGSLQQSQVNLFNEAFFAFIGGTVTSYDAKGQTYLDEGYNKNPDVFSVISQISRKFASVPGVLKKEKDKKLAKQYYEAKDLGIKRILETKAFDDVEISEPLDRPNYYQTESEFKELWETFMLLNGNAYQWLLCPEEGPNAGRPIARFLLPSHLMYIVLKKDADLSSAESPIDHYKLIIGNSYIDFKAEDIIHSKFPNPNYDLNGSHLYGQSPLKASLRNVQSQNVTIDENIKTMKNRGVYGFIHAKDGQTPLTHPQAEELKEKLVKMSASADNLGRIAGSSAAVGFTQMSINTKDLMPFEFLKYDQKAICNALGWSDKLLNNDEGAKYDNLDAAWKMPISNRITPDLKIYEQGLNEKYYPRFKELAGAKVVFDVSELPEMQQDMKALVEWMEKALDNGAITPEEFRIALKYPETNMPEMKQHYLKTGLTPIEDVAVNELASARAFNLDKE